MIPAAAHAPVPDALTSGFHRALLASAIFVLATAILALRTTNTRGETDQPVAEAVPAPAEPAPRRSPRPALEDAA